MESIARWLFLPSGRLPEIRRAVGVLLLLILPEVVFWNHEGTANYNVPAWRWGGVALEIPMPPAWLEVAMWGAYAVAALAMIARDGRRVWPAVAAAVLAYFGWRDGRACNASYVQLMFSFLVALLFAGGPVNCSRRLIQCSLTACYAFSVVQKASMPEWRDGHTLLSILRHADGVRPGLVRILEALPPVPDLAWVLAPVVIASEAFIAAGLWWPRARYPAMLLGVLLHAGMTTMLHSIDIFAPVMLTGYLAFVDDPAPAAEATPRPRRAAVALACVYLAAVVLVPARIYLPPMRPWRLLTHHDHPLWTFSMFSQMDRVDSVAVSYVDRQGSTHDVPPVGRMLGATSDVELEVIADAVLREVPEAEEVRVLVRVTVNHRRGLEKRVVARRGRPPVLDVREVG